MPRIGLERRDSLADIVAVKPIDDARRGARSVEQNLELGDRGIGHRGGRRAGVRSRVVSRRGRGRNSAGTVLRSAALSHPPQSPSQRATCAGRDSSNREDHEEEEDEELVNAHRTTCWHTDKPPALRLGCRQRRRSAAHGENLTKMPQNWILGAASYWTCAEAKAHSKPPSTGLGLPISPYIGKS